MIIVSIIFTIEQNYISYMVFFKYLTFIYPVKFPLRSEDLFYKGKPGQEGTSIGT